MERKLPEIESGRLERSCRRPSGGVRTGRIRIGRGGEGIERAQAYFLGQAFAPHRHDTYAIGITLAGVQTFRYRGGRHYCLPGQCHILGPDEVHDGGAATEEGFGYRIVYIEPVIVQQALGGKPLPCPRCPVVAQSLLPQAFRSQAWEMDAEIDGLAAIDIGVAAAELLALASSGDLPKERKLAFARLSLVRDLIAACPAKGCSMPELERLCSLDRWTIARQFRALFGTSPSRFRMLRRLDQVRRLLANGASLAMAAAEAGFADQSHMSRCFKRTYGLTPATWVAALVPQSDRGRG